MKQIDCPFRAFDWVYEKIKYETNIVFVDFHAEATAEKIAFGWYANGRASIVVGTHTHVPTADNRVLSGGTAYITDVGMTGPYDSVIGMKKEGSIKDSFMQLRKSMKLLKKISDSLQYSAKLMSAPEKHCQ